MADVAPPQSVQVQIPRMGGLPILPATYFNGFGLTGATTDITVVLMNGATQVGLIQASPSVIKELAIALNNSIAEMEKVTEASYLPLGVLLKNTQKNKPSS